MNKDINEMNNTELTQASDETWDELTKNISRYAEIQVELTVRETRN